jgi:hypothetical protein
MSTQHEFYLARAAEARAEATKAQLDNVRQRSLRSEAAWMTMAARAERSDKLRTKAEAEKAAARASERGEAVG